MNEIWSKSKKDRLNDFSQRCINHAILETTFIELKSIHSSAPPDGIIMVIGPTAVGKSTLNGKFKAFLLEDENPCDSVKVPFVDLSLTISGNRKMFDWIDFYKKAILRINELLVEEIDIDYQTQDIKRGQNGRLVIQPRTTERDLRNAYINCLQTCHPKAVILDEGQHLKKTIGAKSLLDQMDTIKSLCNDSGTPHVLFGTYELLDLVNLNDQLSRRSQYIHFSRYHPQQDKKLGSLNGELNTHYDNFIRVVKSFQERLPFEKVQNLEQHHKFLYLKSAGLVGVLKEWLVRALNKAIDLEAKRISLEILEETALTNGQLLQIVREVVNGEKAMAEMEDKEPLLWELLRTVPKPKRIDKSPKEPNQNGKISPKPGNRNPTRDPVGNSTLDAD